MTREEYIRWLKLLDEELTFDALVDGKDEMDMHEMIFGLCETLKQEPCEDAVSRQAVLDGIEELKRSPWCTDKRGNGFEYLITEALEVVADLCVKQAPSVNPQEPKTGHREYNDIYDHYLCGNCKTIVMDYDNYCPNCGCRMVEPQESEEDE